MIFNYRYLRINNTRSSYTSIPVYSIIFTVFIHFFQRSKTINIHRYGLRFTGPYLNNWLIFMQLNSCNWYNGFITFFFSSNRLEANLLSLRLWIKDKEWKLSFSFYLLSNCKEIPLETIWVYLRWLSNWIL